MRRRAPVRPIAAAVLAAATFAVAAAGCGREGDLIETRAATPPPASTLTEPPTGTMPAVTTPAPTRTQPRGAATPGTATTATTTTAVPGAPATDDAGLRATAASYARRRFGVRVPINDVTLRRSRRAPRWAIASGADGRTLWVVWLRDGTVALATTDVRRFNPVHVPCDIRPAFSESSC